MVLAHVVNGLGVGTITVIDWNAYSIIATVKRCCEF